MHEWQTRKEVKIVRIKTKKMVCEKERGGKIVFTDDMGSRDYIFFCPY